MSGLLRKRGIPAVLLALVSGALVAAAPAARYVVEDEVVYDRRTNLHWQRADDGTLRTHAQAISYCASRTLAGRVGWRLPTIAELQTLIDVKASSPALDATAFPDARVDGYWSSTAYAADDTRVWWLDMAKGRPGTAMRSESVHVLCVR